MDKRQLLQHVRVLYHSCVRLDGQRVVYTDPYGLNEAPHDADVVLITHEHYDHFSPADLVKVRQASTLLVVPEPMKQAALAAGFAEDKIITARPGKRYEIDGLTIDAVSAYNVDKAFHPREQQWLGYIVRQNDLRYYIAGDTDLNVDNQRVRCDVAFLPVGGTYTMNAEEAVQLAKVIQPKVAVPTHYGAIVGEKADGQRFCQLLPPEIASAVRMERFAE